MRARVLVNVSRRVSDEPITSARRDWRELETQMIAESLAVFVTRSDSAHTPPRRRPQLRATPRAQQHQKNARRERIVHAAGWFDHRTADACAAGDAAGVCWARAADDSGTSACTGFAHVSIACSHDECAPRHCQSSPTHLPCLVCSATRCPPHPHATYICVCLSHDRLVVVWSSGEAEHPGEHAGSRGRRECHD